MLRERAAITEFMTRRRLLTASVGGIAALASTGAIAAYAVVLEPRYRLVVREYRLSLPGWDERPPMTICLLADPHCCEPWMPLSRLQQVVQLANSLQPDLHVVLGDLPAHHRFVFSRLPMMDVVAVLAGLSASLGTFAVLGNHDWWDDLGVQQTGIGRPAIEGYLNQAGIPVLANKARLLPHPGGGVWLCGTDSMLAFQKQRIGADDLQGTLEQIRTDAPAILIAHEPDLFPSVPARVALTVSGHTHGGQIRIAGYSPMAPSRYGNRYAYGLTAEASRTLIVSGGLGCSIAPVRLGVPPELTLIHLT